MKLERVELFLVRLALRHPFETSGAVERHVTRVLARAEAGGEIGWGESVALDAPWYSEETPDTVWHALERFIAPRLLAAPLGGAQDVGPRLEWIRGNRMAKATLEMAIWDLDAKRHGVPLSRSLGGARERIPCGVAIGMQPTIGDLLERIAAELQAGYQRVKVKIAPGRDIEIAEAVRRAFPDLAFMVDANSAYGLGDVPLLQRIDDTQPAMIEQPLAHDDLVDHATLQRQLRSPICLDESIRHAADAQKAISLGAARVINVKPGRVGGHGEAKRVHDVCAGAGVPIWCGGMLESGIGRAHNVHLASLPNFSLPGDIAASSRYFEEDLIEEPLAVTADGTMQVPTGLGIGVTVRERHIRRVASRALELRPA